MAVNHLFNSNGTYLSKYYEIGIVTSIFNYSMDSKYFQYLDSFIMISGVFIDLVLVHTYSDKLLYLFCLFSFFLSKLTKQKRYNLLSHFLVSILHNNLLKK